MWAPLCAAMTCVPSPIVYSLRRRSRYHMTRNDIHLWRFQAIWTGTIAVCAAFVSVSLVLNSVGMRLLLGAALWSSLFLCWATGVKVIGSTIREQQASRPVQMGRIALVATELCSLAPIILFRIVIFYKWSHL